MRTLQGHELQKALHLPRFGQRSVSEWLDLPYFIMMVFFSDGEGGRVEVEIHRIFRAVANKRRVTWSCWTVRRPKKYSTSRQWTKRDIWPSPEWRVFSYLGRSLILGKCRVENHNMSKLQHEFYSRSYQNIVTQFTKWSLLPDLQRLASKAVWCGHCGRMDVGLRSWPARLAPFQVAHTTKLYSPGKNGSPPKLYWYSKKPFRNANVQVLR